MSTVIIAVIIVAFVLVICILLIAINSKHRKKAAAELVALFQRKGKENNLLIPKWEMAGKMVIGLETDNKVLFAFRKHVDQYTSYMVDLSKVRSCLKQKIYHSKSDNVRTKERVEKQVERISLQFEFTDERPPLLITFYDPVNCHLLEMAEMEQKATDWERLVQTIIHPN
jgi:hypothetical protein